MESSNLISFHSSAEEEYEKIAIMEKAKSQDVLCRTWPKTKSSNSTMWERTSGCELKPEETRARVRSPTTRDEFWEALMSNYNYLMDEGLIASCKEASGELYSPEDGTNENDGPWSFTEFIHQFNQLHDWLHRLQTMVLLEEDMISVNGVVMEELQKAGCLWQVLREQATQLGTRYPDMRDELQKRVNVLNNKWEATVQQALNGAPASSPDSSLSQPSPQNQDDAMFQEVAYQMRCLRRWLREVESQIQPFAACSTWTLDALEKLHSQQKVLQSEIESRGQFVSALLKACAALPESENDAWRDGRRRVARVAHNLERRWHALWLRSLEWQCFVEELIRHRHVGSTPSTEGGLEASLQEEPVRKYPRLSGGGEMMLQESPAEQQDHRGGEPMPLTNDKGIMVGVTGIAQLKAECGGCFGRFEIIQDVGYSSESSAHLSNDERQDFIRVYSYSPSSNKPLVSEYVEPKDNEVPMDADLPATSQSSILTYLPPDKYPSHSLHGLHVPYDEEQPRIITTKSPLLTSKTAKFYTMTSIPPEHCDEDHLDSDNIDKEIDIFSKPSDLAPLPPKNPYMDTSENSLNNASSLKGEDSTKEETESLTATTGPIINHTGCTSENVSSIPSTPQKNPPLESSSLDIIQRLVVQADLLVQKEATVTGSPERVYRLENKMPKSMQVKEWLQNCRPTGVDASITSEDQGSDIASLTGQAVDSSCDASGECTTNESVSDESESSEEDVNENMSMTQSFTGSVETVVPSEAKPRRRQRLSDVSKQEERSGSAEPHVVLRSKKRRTRSRPWSVTEGFPNSSHLGLSPFSNSEGALNTLLASKSSHNRLSPKSGAGVATSSSTFSIRSRGEVLISGRVRRQFSRQHGTSDSGSDQASSIRRLGSSEGSRPRRRRSSSGLLLPPSEMGAASSPLHRPIGSSVTSLGGVAPHRRKTSCPSEPLKMESKHHSTSAAPTDQEQPEDQSSVSDQAWDGYQDPPYFSEPYSEQALDEDLVRKVMEFGDDYRAFIGSDASSVSGRPQKKWPSSDYRHSTQSSKWKYYRRPHSDTESDMEEIRNIFSQNNRALQQAKYTLGVVQESSGNFATSFAELLATCQTHLKCLKDFQSHFESLALPPLSTEEIAQLNELIVEWESLQSDLLSSQAATAMQTNVANAEASDPSPLPTPPTATTPQSNGDVGFECRGDLPEVVTTLKDNIDRIERSIIASSDSFSGIEQVEDQILVFQVCSQSLEELRSSLLNANFCAKKFGEHGYHSQLVELYRRWEHLHEQTNVRLSNLQFLRSRWHKFNELLDRVQTLLENNGYQKESVEEEIKQLTELAAAVAERGATDALQDDLRDLKERFVLPPSSTLPQEILEEDDDENLDLTNSMETKNEKHNGSFDASPESLSLPEIAKEVTINTDGGSPPPRRPSRFWRVLRAALPLQLALVLLCCLASMLEPHCCDFLNNFSFSPQLRYVRGPPPV